MQALILAGGMGVRMGSETLLTPKPMIRIGKMPVLWHIMKYLYEYGIDEFIILGGYKIDDIRYFWRNYGEYRYKYTTYGSKETRLIPYGPPCPENWSVTVVNTGEETPTAGRLLQAKDLIAYYKPSLVTYADGVADVDIGKLLNHATQSDALITITAVNRPGRFGTISIDKDNNNIVTQFREKPLSEDLINGGFWIMKNEAFKYMHEDEMLEDGTIPRMVEERLVDAYVHDGFWSPMDTGRDKEYLTELWESGEAPWRIWDDNGKGILEE